MQTKGAVAAYTDTIDLRCGGIGDPHRRAVNVGKDACACRYGENAGSVDASRGNTVFGFQRVGVISPREGVFRFRVFLAETAPADRFAIGVDTEKAFDGFKNR